MLLIALALTHDIRLKANVLVRADSGITTLEQLRGKTVNFSDVGSATQQSAREVFTNSAVGFMRDSASSFTMPRVASFRRRCTESTSQASKKASQLGAGTWPSARARSREASLPHTVTCMPKARP